MCSKVEEKIGVCPNCGYCQHCGRSNQHWEPRLYEHWEPYKITWTGTIASSGTKENFSENQTPTGRLCYNDSS
jgi:hypothetical protein